MCPMEQRYLAFDCYRLHAGNLGVGLETRKVLFPTSVHSYAVAGL